MSMFRRLGREVAAAAVLLMAALTGPAPALADSTATPRLVHPSMGRETPRPNPGVATLLSHAGIVAPIVISTQIRSESRNERVDRQVAVLGLGLAIGPATGYWYGDVAARGTRGAAGRLLLAGVVYGTSAWLRREGTEFTVPSLGFGLLGIGAAAFGSGWALWDAATVAPRVERRNAEVRAVSWQMGAGVTPSGAPALAVTAGF